MSYDIVPQPSCGREFFANGKDHKCVLPENHGLQRCKFDCGERMPKVYRGELKLAHWKRGGKKVTK